jgi:hypothetical protein
MMARSVSVKRKKKGRSSTGTDRLVAVRLPPEVIKAIDAWAKRENAGSRSKAVRHMVYQTLAAAELQPRGGRHKGAFEASRWAAQEIDRRTDQLLPAEERERRKDRLTKGPSEFREMREDLPKGKR